MIYLDIQKNLILLNNEDKTQQIKYIKYNNGKYEITFDNNNKTYSYNYNSVQSFKNPQEHDIKDNIVYEGNNPISGTEKIIEFDGQYIRIIFKTGYNKLYPKSKIEIKKSCLKDNLSRNCFEYLKKLAERVSITTDDGASLLSKQYNRIEKISPDSVLANYLSYKKLKIKETDSQMIFPFGFNLSQKDATKKALSNKISIIEGPPGTGKTQTILNIIANAIYSGKTVAIVSNNNSATENVLEKLEKYNVDFIAAFLGSNKNKEKFIENQNTSYPDIENWILENRVIEELENNLKDSQINLDQMLEKQNQVAVLKEERSTLGIEQKYFKNYYNEASREDLHFKALFIQKSESIMELLVEYKYTLEKKGTLPLKNKIMNLIKYGIYTFKFYNNPNEKVIDFLQNKYYDLKTGELNRKIKKLQTDLKDYNFDKEMKEYSNTSMDLLKAKLAVKYKKNKLRPLFSKDDLWKESFISFVNEYPVILSTTHSLRNCSSENYLFDYVIIDEASQVDIVTGALALSCGKNAVIVGDQKQLPNVVTSNIASETKKIFNNYNLSDAYSYFDNSLLSSIIKLDRDIPSTLLKEHYRCHPKIIGFCNKKFYNNELIILTNEDSKDTPLIVYKTVKGNHARGKINQRQIDVVLNEIIPQQKLDDSKESIGIISPYRLQAEELQKAIGTRVIEADTVHKYQGREKDVIIITTVSNETNDFIDNASLINVAVSRAVNKLILVVPDNDFAEENSNIGDLIKYIQYNNSEIVNSNIHSVFDLLYKNYSEKLLTFMKNSKMVSEFASENLMNALLEKVLLEPEFRGLSYVLHYPLRGIINDISKLTEDEHKFGMNNLTHLDFLVFNMIDKTPVLAIEVDGYAFHAGNEKQLLRDRMKDGILLKYGIGILRVGTNESGEENRVREMLREVIK